LASRTGGKEEIKVEAEVLGMAKGKGVPRRGGKGRNEKKTS